MEPDYRLMPTYVSITYRCPREGIAQGQFIEGVVRVRPDYVSENVGSIVVWQKSHAGEYREARIPVYVRSVEMEMWKEGDPFPSKNYSQLGTEVPMNNLRVNQLPASVPPQFHRSDSNWIGMQREIKFSLNKKVCRNAEVLPKDGKRPDKRVYSKAKTATVGAQPRERASVTMGNAGPKSASFRAQSEMKTFNEKGAQQPQTFGGRQQPFFGDKDGDQADGGGDGDRSSNAVNSSGGGLGRRPASAHPGAGVGGLIRSRSTPGIARPVLFGKAFAIPTRHYVPDAEEKPAEEKKPPSRVSAWQGVPLLRLAPMTSLERERMKARRNDSCLARDRLRNRGAAQQSGQQYYPQAVGSSVDQDAASDANTHPSNHAETSEEERRRQAFAWKKDVDHEEIQLRKILPDTSGRVLYYPDMKRVDQIIKDSDASMSDTELGGSKGSSNRDGPQGGHRREWGYVPPHPGNLKKKRPSTAGAVPTIRARSGSASHQNSTNSQHGPLAFYNGDEGSSGAELDGAELDGAVAERQTRSSSSSRRSSSPMKTGHQEGLPPQTGDGVDPRKSSWNKDSPTKLLILNDNSVATASEEASAGPEEVFLCPPPMHGGGGTGATRKNVQFHVTDSQDRPRL
ncbi:unnamed protein product [Amoebophrya sp. A25]|nr:unnamed protein product [Amoebophrya sp. A25]|eukprot:GSA25T00013580001.1